MPLAAADIVDACPVFARVRDSARQKLLDIVELRTFQRGQTICRQDDPCPGVFIVGSGLVRIYKLAPSGKEHVLHLAGPRQLFLEVAVVAEMDCPAFSQAIEDTTCALLPAKPFMDALRQDHQFCLQLLVGMAIRVRQFVGLLEDIVLRDALSRVAQYLLTASRDQGNAQISLPVLKKHLASHLNLTSETLSRCLRQLTDAGIIEPGDAQEIRIAQQDALREAAEGMFPML